MIKKLFLLFLIVVSINANAGNKILYYFNRPVDNSVSTTINAVYLNNCMADTFAAYINRAKYSIDIAIYDYSQGSFANMATAVNNAYSRGVQVRWIYDGSSTNSGLSAVNSAIHTLGSPTTSNYTIMHNKFVVIDANSTDQNDAIVMTGSFNWESSQFSTDHNNAVIIQDSALAHAYTAEFNMMWGDPGLVPNSSNSKFGQYKTDLGRHNFTIEGKQVELYFSPSDGTNSHIQSTIATANTDMYFGMYTFTDNSDASMIVSKYNSGVYVAGIDDSYSNSYSPYTTFSSNLGANFKVYNSPGIFHSKYLIVDPSDKCSDPIVLTGSHNWTTSANTKNDENTLIIHSDTAANVYYQSFHADFAVLGGSLTTVTGCPSSVPSNTTTEKNTSVYPNPSDGTFTVSYSLSSMQNVKIDIYNTTGQKTLSVINEATQPAGEHVHNINLSTPGMYLVQFQIGDEHFTKKIFVPGR
jgi:phosphatidylserine/phosphatidylglycerophosphate/cardiolipin synthase-like enzyme